VDTTGPNDAHDERPSDEAGATADGHERQHDDAAGWGGAARERVERSFERGKEAFGAFKDALEETFTDARERGDLTTDRARELWGKAVDRARDATSDARDRFDFVTHAEYEALLLRVEALERLLGVQPPAPEASESAETPDESAPADDSGAASTTDHPG
jgi:hypothetical protein